MPDIKVVQYTDEVRDALRRAMNMPTPSSGKDPYPHAKRQTMIQSSTAEAETEPQGMFRVTENGDGTVSVTGGYILISTVPYTGPNKIDGTTLQRVSGKNYVVISIAGSSRFFELVADINLAYVPGEKIVWPIAALGYGTTPFVQLWQGGMIDFTTKYLIG